MKQSGHRASSLAVLGSQQDSSETHALGSVLTWWTDEVATVWELLTQEASILVSTCSDFALPLPTRNVAFKRKTTHLSHVLIASSFTFFSAHSSYSSTSSFCMPLLSWTQGGKTKALSQRVTLVTGVGVGVGVEGGGGLPQPRMHSDVFPPSSPACNASIWRARAHARACFWPICDDE